MSFTQTRNRMLVLGAMVSVTALPAGNAASAPTAELANKCREMMIKAYPPARPGAKQGNAQNERGYFRTCIARNGKMEESPPSTVGRGNNDGAQK